MNMDFRIALFVILFVAAGCNKKDDIQSNETVLTVFSEAEAKDLQSIHDYFSDQICKSTGKDNPADCFEKFIADLMAEAPSSGIAENPVDRTELDDFFRKLESGVFDKVWRRNEAYDEEGLNHETISMKPFGEYGRFLELVGKDDPAIREYHTDLGRAGTLSATMVASVMLFPAKYNVSDCRVRLVLAIHYITFFYR